MASGRKTSRRYFGSNKTKLSKTKIKEIAKRIARKVIATKRR